MGYWAAIEYKGFGIVFLAELVAGKLQNLRVSRIMPDISIKTSDTSLKSWNTEYFNGIGQYSEQFVDLPLQGL